MINENLFYLKKIELVIGGKLNRIYYFNVQFDKKGKAMKNTERHNIFLFCLYLV